MKINRFILNKILPALILAGFCGLNSSFPAFAQENMPAENRVKTPQAPLKGNATIIDLSSDKVEYFQDKNQFVATGSAKVFLEDQNSTLEARKITYDQDKQSLIAEDDVKITKDGKIITGRFAIIDLNRESALITDPATDIGQINITAKSADVYPKKMEIRDGKAVMNGKPFAVTLSSIHFASSEFENNDKNLSTNKLRTTNPNKKPVYKIIAREITVKNRQGVNIISVRNADIFLGKIRIATIPYLELTSDKQNRIMETQLPEIGHNKELGYYLGPGHVFNLPNQSTLKVAPLLTYDHGIGAGGLFRYTSDKNKTEFGITSTHSKFIDNMSLRGEQEIFTPQTHLFYNSNTYINDGVFGYVRPRYQVEMVDDRKLASALNMEFWLRSSAGYAQDYDRNYGTTKFQLQGNLFNTKPVLQFRDMLKLSLVSQFKIAAYGNGDTAGILRGGPKVDARLGPVSLSSTYMQAGIYGKTPFDFDEHIYGRSNLLVNGDVKLTKFLDVGYCRNLNLSNIKGRSENQPVNVYSQIYARVGPENFKIAMGYDTRRKATLFGFDMLLGADNAAINFDKLFINQIND